MTLRLEVSRALAASPERVWDELVDWPGQDRWIPLTHVRVDGRTGARSGRPGVGAERLPPGGAPGRAARPVRRHRLDAARRQVGDPPGELAVLHLGPYFTGEGSFKVLARPGRRHAWSAPRSSRCPAARPSRRSCGSPARHAARVRGEPRHLRGARRSAPCLLSPTTSRGPDGLVRCPWSLSAPEYVAYHDTEWGWPVHSVAGLYERLTLEAFQSGLPGSRSCASARLPARRSRASSPRSSPASARTTGPGCWPTPASCGTSPRSTPRSRTPGWSPSWGSGSSTWSGRSGRRRPRPRPDEFRRSRPESTALAKALKAAGIRFVGPTTAYALMQATGLVDDHRSDCEVPEAAVLHAARRGCRRPAVRERRAVRDNRTRVPRSLADEDARWQR